MSRVGGAYGRRYGGSERAGLGYGGGAASGKTLIVEFTSVLTIGGGC